MSVRKLFLFGFMTSLLFFGSYASAGIKGGEACIEHEVERDGYTHKCCFFDADSMTCNDRCGRDPFGEFDCDQSTWDEDLSGGVNNLETLLRGY